MDADLRSILMDRLVPAIERIPRLQFVVPNSGGKKAFAPYPSNSITQPGVDLPGAGTYGSHPQFIKWVYGLSGKAELALNGNRYAIEPGDLGFIPPKTPHLQRAIDRKQPFEVLWFCCLPLSNRMTIHSCSYQGGNRYQSIEEAIIEDRADLAKYFVRTVDEVQTRTRGWCSFLRASVNEVLLGAMRHLEEHGSGLSAAENQRGMVEIAKAYIQSNFARALTLKEISREVFLSPNYFSSLFAKATGMTVFDYVQQVRLEEARRLLRETSLPVRDVARQTGYQNAAHFTRTFKLQARQSPREFRNAGCVKVAEKS
jgi:AraC-like DNA-binding protein